MADETWTCARCGRTSREGEALAWWDLIDDGSDDPEEMPVVCPDCLYTPEKKDQIAEAIRHTSLADAVAEIGTSFDVSVEETEEP
ncbi:MAG: hypothetical protein ABSB24_02850 [Gaiellaceae bacterium]|jgi:DNA-directed RNA polymerase subunit RPC12/RpoP